MIVDTQETCELCESELALPYDPEDGEALCASCQMVMETGIGLQDFKDETNPVFLADTIEHMLHRGEYTDDGHCSGCFCPDLALPRHSWGWASAVIKLCTTHAVETYLPLTLNQDL
jgi:hypothetical protein